MLAALNEADQQQFLCVICQRRLPCSAAAPSAGKLMGQLHDRNCRRAYAPPEAFQAEALPVERFQAEIQAGTAAGRQLSEAGGGRGWGLLSYAPYLVPFRERAKLFQAVVAQVRWVRIPNTSSRGALPSPMCWQKLTLGSINSSTCCPCLPACLLLQERERYHSMQVAHSMSHEFGTANRFFPIKRTQARAYVMLRQISVFGRSYALVERMSGILAHPRVCSCYKMLSSS